MRSIEPQDSASTYARILDALPIVAFLARADGTISYLSRGWAALTGLDPTEALGDRSMAIVHPEQRARVTAAWTASVGAGSAYRDELQVRFADGRYRWVLSRANAMRDPETNRIVGWFGTITDIDERKRVEETLRSQAEFNQRLVDGSDDCIAILDLAARLVWMSANGARTLRFGENAAALGTPWLALWVEGLNAAAREALAAALRGGSGSFTGTRYVDGERRSFEVVLRAILDAAGAPERLLAIARDVTPQRRALEALEESEARYRAFAEALPGVAWSASPAGELEFVSEHWSKTRGREPDEALAYRWLAGLHPDDRERTRLRWHASVTSGEPYEAQFRVRMADGSYRWQLVRALATRSEAGAITRWIGVNVDIDDRYRSDEARDMFERLAENSSDFIGIADSGGSMRYVNAAGRRLLEIDSPAGVLETNVLDYFAPLERSAGSAVLAAVERDGQWTGDVRFRNFRTGAPVPVACNVFRLVDALGHVTGIATISRDRRRALRIEAGLRLLARTGAAFVASIEPSAAVRNVVRAFVPDFASYCLIDAVSDGRWERTVVHRDPSQERILHELPPPAGRHPVVLAMAEGKSSLVLGDGWLADAPDRTEAVRALRLRSFITVPVIEPSGDIVGGLTCGRDDAEPNGDFDADDLAFVEEAARRAGAAIANGRLYERERRIAVELQKASLPVALPRLERLRISAAYLPGSDEATIGGDWYDAFELDDGRVAISVGDVLGHGLRAAVTMTKLRQAMQTAAMIDADPLLMLAVADRTLGLVDTEGYSTALAAIYDPKRRTLTFAQAGHPGPLVRLPGGEVRAHDSRGPMLGLRAGAQDGAAVVPLPPDASVVFFTDGLVEATRDLDAGYARLHAAVASAEVMDDPEPAKAIVRRCLGDVHASDDIAVLVVRTGPCLGD